MILQLEKEKEELCQLIQNKEYNNLPRSRFSSIEIENHAGFKKQSQWYCTKLI